MRVGIAARKEKKVSDLGEKKFSQRLRDEISKTLVPVARSSSEEKKGEKGEKPCPACVRKNPHTKTPGRPGRGNRKKKKKNPIGTKGKLHGAHAQKPSACVTVLLNGEKKNKTEVPRKWI